MLTKIKVTNNNLNQLETLIQQIWPEVFLPIIGKEQVDYMLSHYQSKEAIQTEIAAGVCYFLLYAENQPVGYTAYKLEKEVLFISKLYIKAEYRGKGYMSDIFSWYEKSANETAHKLQLRVNRQNQQAISVYLHKGFSVVKEDQASLGDGFIMDDYIMEKNVC